MKTKKTSAILFLFLALSTVCFGLNQTGENLPADSLTGIQTTERISIAFMISILLLKITAFILGYLIVKMGHDTLVKGITGEFNFGFSGSGFNTKLKSASPGALFVLMGSAIIIWSMVAEKPLKINTTPSKTIEKGILKTTPEVAEEKDVLPGADSIDSTKPN